MLPAIVLVVYYRFVKKEDPFRTIWPISDREKLKKFGFTIVRKRAKENYIFMSLLLEKILYLSFKILYLFKCVSIF